MELLAQLDQEAKREAEAFGLQDIRIRLALWLIVTPWPVLIAINNESGYVVGRHPVTALYAVGTPALAISYMLAGVAVALIIHASRIDRARLWWIAAVILHTYIIDGYITSNAVMYV